MEQEILALQKLELFRDLHPEQLQMIVFASTHKVTPQGHLLFRQGDVGAAAYLIVRGRVSVLSVLSTGEEFEEAYSENTLLGENAILADCAYISTARALTEVETMVIPREVFMRMLNAFPEAAQKITHIVQKRLDATLGDLNQFRPDLIHNKLS